jgi:uncharacterized surface protein with fasciclin (FAS1) repeats
MRTTRSKTLAVAAVALLSLSTAACGSDSDGGSKASSDTTSEAPASDAGADLVGPGCADYAKAVPDGAGSVDGMAQDPVATAASNNPLLKTLESVLTYHVIPGQIAPADIDGTLKTVNGADLKVTGSGDDIRVGDQAGVICGGVKTANATVYLIDTVLMPPS